MYIKSKAVVISSVKYSTSDLIVKCLTDKGVHSFMIKGLFSQRKGRFSVAHFQNLTQLNICFSIKNNDTPGYIREIDMAYSYQSLTVDFRKNLICFYLSELLLKVIREGDQNSEAVLEYIMTSLQWLDIHKFDPNFHLIFTLGLTRYLGFYPADNYSTHTPYFDLNEGVFTSDKSKEEVVSEYSSDIFVELLGMSYGDDRHGLRTGKLRGDLLQMLLRYYSFHVSNFDANLKSLNVLPGLFN